MTSRHGTTTTPATTVAGVVACVAAVVLLVLLATWAASDGGEPAFRGDGRPAPTEFASVTETPEEEPAQPSGEELARDREPAEQPWWARVLGILLQVGVGLALAYALLRLVRSAARRRALRRPRGPATEDAGIEEVLEPQRVAEAMDADAESQRDLLREETRRPGNAIIACWHRFEVQAERAQVARRSWETTSEFVRRLLEMVEADPQLVGELALLYREARYSDHEMGEDERRRAIAALDAVHAQVRSRRPTGRASARGGASTR